MKYGWPGKKRTYHTGKKRCRYLKDMRAEFSTYNKPEEKKKPRIITKHKPKLKKGSRDHRGRIV